MSLSVVSVVLIEPVAVFEFGVAVEVFGLDRTDDGVPPFDFRVCTARSRHSAAHQEHLTFHHHRQPRPGGRGRQRPRDRGGHHRRSPDDYPAEVLQVLRDAYAAGCHPAQPVLGLIRPRRGWPAGRAQVHHALDVRRRHAGRVPRGHPRSAGALCRRRQSDHQRRHRGRDRRLPAPGPARAGHGDRHQDRAADGGAAAAGRRAAAVRGDADSGMLGRQPDSGTDLGAGQPGRAAFRGIAGQTGDDERAHIRPPVQRRDRDDAAQVARAAADPGGPQPAWRRATWASSRSRPGWASTPGW